jgi:hypothetical protein
LGVRQSKLWIYSPENEVTKNWLESQYINLINEKFTRRLEIFEEQNYREKLLVIEECLKLNQRKS